VAHRERRRSTTLGDVGRPSIERATPFFLVNRRSGTLDDARRVRERNVIAAVGLARACRWCRPTDGVREPQNRCEEMGGESAVVL
jgi:hypothetical protein